MMGNLSTRAGTAGNVWYDRAALPEHCFGTSRQFANPYTYGGDPVNYVDPNGEWVYILIGAASGAAVATGTVSGAVGGVVSGGLSYVPFAGSPIIEQSASNAASSMVAAGMNGGNIGDAAVNGLLQGADSALAYTPVSLAMVYAINGIGGVDALNRFFSLDPDGSWAIEAGAADNMQANPGSVSASVVNDFVGFLIALISGGGPFSHVRGSDKEGKIVESNSEGIHVLGEDYKINDNRLTFVTKRYVGGQKYGVTAASLRAKGAGAYFSNWLCVGATSKVNPYYTKTAPNAFVPWGMRNTSNFHY